ncbi:hypothetical protein Taro_008108 [Colocasia esculenta]|uniref:Uncharacterized protein n=1 Tax=Colocasia esculenta TaxID=4460 RepID=A0A843TSY4_COLES|nr:hypothetical protein [Colocasia esculenta]
MLHYLDDLDRVKVFAWADGFQKLILNKINDAHESAKNKISGVKTLAKRNNKSDLEGKRFIYGCSTAFYSFTKVDDEEEQEQEERQENKKEKDKEESEETREMSPSTWTKVMSEMCNELTAIVCRIEERDRQTRRELEEFGTNLSSLFKQMKSYMAER